MRRGVAFRDSGEWYWDQLLAVEWYGDQLLAVVWYWDQLFGLDQQASVCF